MTLRISSSSSSIFYSEPTACSFFNYLTFFWLYRRLFPDWPVLLLSIADLSLAVFTSPLFYFSLTFIVTSIRLCLLLYTIFWYPRFLLYPTMFLLRSNTLVSAVSRCFVLDISCLCCIWHNRSNSRFADTWLCFQHVCFSGLCHRGYSISFSHFKSHLNASEAVFIPRYLNSPLNHLPSSIFVAALLLSYI